MKRWQIQEAKARLSEVVKSSRSKGPQEITVHGRPAAVLLSREDFDKLSKRRPRFAEFIRSSPLAGTDLRLVRDKSPARRVAL